MKSINAQIKQLSGLLGTDDVTEWEEEFIHSINQKTNNGQNTTALTEKQLTIIERIYKKNYEG
jgi:hypothetical protein